MFYELLYIEAAMIFFKDWVTVIVTVVLPLMLLMAVVVVVVVLLSPTLILLHIQSVTLLTHDNVGTLAVHGV